MRVLRTSLACVAMAVIYIIGMHPASAQTTGPTPYLSFNDSPFKGLNFSVFYLEDFEDGMFNTPGVVGISNTPGTSLGVNGPATFTDSVDGDDGIIDGFGRNGHSLGEAHNLPSGNMGYTFVFDPLVLGGLPTHAGLVWTDGSTTASTQFEAFGADNTSLGIIGPVKIGNSSFAGETAEDRFFGVIYSGGISRITIRDPGSINGLEIDHLQYGILAPTVTPEGDSLLLISSGILPLAALGLWRRQRKRRQA